MQRWGFCCRLKSVLTIPFLLTLVAGAACSHPQQPATPQQLLFVTLPETRSVAIFGEGATGDARPLATIRETAPDTPIDASANMRGEIFVGNRNGTINIYAGRDFNYERVRTLAGPHTQMGNLSSMAVDLSGGIYVTDLGAGPARARVMWFAAALNGNVTPDRVVSGPHTELTSPTGIAIDSSEQVYVADHDSGKVLIFDSDARGDAAPVAAIDGLNGPERLFVDQDLNIYVSCKGDSSIAVFMPNGPRKWTRSATITSAAMRDPEGVTADNTGRIAVAVRGAVLFFAPGANGATAPVQELQGPLPMNPTGLLIH